MRPLNEDTAADKLLRFVVGAAIGVGATWFRLSDSILPMLLAGLAAGVLAMAFGNRFIERLVKPRWWD